MKHPGPALFPLLLGLCAQALAALPQYEVSLTEVISPKDDISGLADLNNPAKSAVRGACPAFTGWAERKTQVTAGQTLHYCQTNPFVRPGDPILLEHKTALLGPSMTVQIRPAENALLEAQVAFCVTEWEGPPPKNPKNPPIDPRLRTRGFETSVRIASGETARLGSLRVLLPATGGQPPAAAFATYFLTVTRKAPPPGQTAAGAEKPGRAEACLARAAQFARDRNDGGAQWYFPEAEPPAAPGATR